MISLITGLLGTAGNLFGSWQERKKIKAAGKVKVEQAKIDGKVKRIQSQIDYDAAYNTIAAKGMASSYKDEYWTIVLSIPAIGCFIPGLADHIMRGFEVLAECPIWYQTCLVGAIAASFGLKGFLRLKNGKKG